LSAFQAGPDVGSLAISSGVSITEPVGPPGWGAAMLSALPFSGASAWATQSASLPAACTTDPEPGRSGLTGRRVMTLERLRPSTWTSRRGRPMKASLLLKRKRRRLGLVMTKPTLPLRFTARVTLNSIRRTLRPG
jgi:hypothetical protein